MGASLAHISRAFLVLALVLPVEARPVYAADEDVVAAPGFEPSGKDAQEIGGSQKAGVVPAESEAHGPGEEIPPLKWARRGPEGTVFVPNTAGGWSTAKIEDDGTLTTRDGKTITPEAEKELLLEYDRTKDMSQYYSDKFKLVTAAVSKHASRIAKWREEEARRLAALQAEQQQQAASEPGGPQVYDPVTNPEPPENNGLTTVPSSPQRPGTHASGSGPQPGSGRYVDPGTKDFQCVPVNGGVMPRSKRISARPLGAAPIANRADCDQAVLNSNHGVICSKTGLDGWKPTHFSGSTPYRQDFGFWGSSIMRFEDCLKASFNSTKDYVCFWGGSYWTVGYTDGRKESPNRGSFSSVDACIRSLGGTPELATSQPSGQDVASGGSIPDPRPRGASINLPIAKAPAHFSSESLGHAAYGKFCGECHKSGGRAAPFAPWVLNKDALAAALDGPDGETKTYAKHWTEKLKETLVDKKNMPPTKELKDAMSKDANMGHLKAFVSERGKRREEVVQLTPHSSGQSAAQLLSRTARENYRRMMPEVMDPELAVVINDPSTLYFDESVLPPGYQDPSETVVGVRPANHSTLVDGAPFRDPKTGKLKVFSHGVGLDPTGNTRTFNMLSLPRDANGKLQKIKVWKENSGNPDKGDIWKWEFPPGTISVEVVYQLDSLGHGYVTEVRKRKKRADKLPDDVDIMVATPTKADLQSALEEVATTNSDLAKEARLVSSNLDRAPIIPVSSEDGEYSVPGLTSRGGTMVIPLMSERLAKAVMKRPFQSSLGAVFDTQGDRVAIAPTSRQAFGIAPQNSTRGAVHTDSQSCSNCHSKANQPIRDLYNYDGRSPADPFRIAMNGHTFQYGNTPGNDGNLRFHPFDSRYFASFGLNTGPHDNRFLNKELLPILDVQGELPTAN